jgi:DNA-binding NarL/FixJ family response regulator
MTATRTDQSDSNAQLSRAETCLRALLTWVGRGPAPGRPAEVASLVDDLLNSDREVVEAALKRVALTSASDDHMRERFRLTAREIGVARLLALGKSNADIAKALSISEHTSRRHTEQVLSKLGLRSRAAVAASLGQIGQLRKTG